MSDDKKPTADSSTAESDKELADLLDSALSDFSKELEKKPTDTTEETEKEVEVADDEVDWSEQFVRQAAEQFETNVSRMLGETDPNSPLTQEHVQLSLQRMAEAAQQVLANPTELSDTSTDFASAITQTLQSLSEGTENLQSPFSEQDIMNMFMGGQTTGGGEQNGFLPFMQGMMQSLLSKEVLYPSLKDILEKYPDWLVANSATLSAEDKQRYENQQKLMQDVCKELEVENEADSTDVKKQRFEKVLSLMQKLQDYGQPPTELVGDVGPALPFDPQGNPEQCCVM